MLKVNHKKNLLYSNLQHIYALSLKNFIAVFFKSGIIADENNCVCITRYKVNKKSALGQVALKNYIFSGVLLSIVKMTRYLIFKSDARNSERRYSNTNNPFKITR